MLLQTLQAVFTDSFGKKPDLINPEIRIQGFRKRDFFFTGRLLTDFTVEMEVTVFVRILVAAVMAELVFRGGIFLDAVDNPFFLKCFQGTVNCRTVRIFKMVFHFR